MIIRLRFGSTYLLAFLEEAWIGIRALLIFLQTASGPKNGVYRFYAAQGGL